MLPCTDKGHYRHFGWNNQHVGHDCECDEGENIKAILSGQVIFCDMVNGFGSMFPSAPGFVIILKHEKENITSLYGHVNPLVKLNDKIEKNQIIGTVAKFFNRGIFLPHCHFCLYPGVEIPPHPWGYVENIQKTKWINPLIYKE